MSGAHRPPMRNQENERQDARGQTTVNLPTPQRVSGFARHLTTGRSMGVRNGESPGNALNGSKWAETVPVIEWIVSTLQCHSEHSKAASQMAGSGPSLRRPSGHRLSQEAGSAGSNHLG
jgi:hypothetical protein